MANKAKADLELGMENVDARFKWYAEHPQLLPHGFQWSRERYLELDPYMREPVHLLHQYGIGTGQSCQGGPGHSYDMPTIALASAAPGEGLRAVGVLIQYGFKVTELHMQYHFDQNQIQESFWAIELNIREIPNGFHLRCPEHAHSEHFKEIKKHAVGIVRRIEQEKEK